MKDLSTVINEAIKRNSAHPEWVIFIYSVGEWEEIVFTNYLASKRLYDTIEEFTYLGKVVNGEFKAVTK